MQLFKSIVSAATLFSMLVSAKPFQKRVIPDDSQIETILNTHNEYRAKHGAQPLTWDNSLAEFADQWSDQCQVGHSGGEHGENMAFGQGDTDWKGIIDLWYDEISDYDFSSPGFNENTGHFTQLVWKDTNSIGCGATFCSNLNIRVYTCEYEPRGNVITLGTDPAMAFKTNVTQSTQ